MLLYFVLGNMKSTSAAIGFEETQSLKIVLQPSEIRTYKLYLA